MPGLGRHPAYVAESDLRGSGLAARFVMIVMLPDDPGTYVLVLRCAYSQAFEKLVRDLKAGPAEKAADTRD